MQRVVSAEEMRWCDETTMKTFGVPGLFLMENAGRGVVEIIKQNYSPVLRELEKRGGLPA